MMSEGAELKLIQPLIDNQRKIEGVVIRSIAERLNDIKTLLPSDVLKLENLLRSGSDSRKINRQVSKLTKLSEKQIKRIIKTVAKDVYIDAKPFYDYRNKSYIPFEKNIELQRKIKAIENITEREYVRLSRTTAFLLRDLSNPLIVKPTKLSNVYNKAIDYAIQSVLSGANDYSQAINQTIQQLVDSGVKCVEYTTESGKKHYRRLDSAVRQNILDSIKQVRQEVQNQVGKEFGADGIELSVHQFSAPDHEPVQGHQFTNEEFEKMQSGQECKDVNGKVFSGFDRPIGAWNCRHFAWSIIIGQAKHNYTEEQLEEIKKKNADGIEVTNTKGEKVKKSMYWCTQKRNEYELELRKLKEGREAAKQAGKEDLESQYTNKIHKVQNEYKYFCSQCGLRTRFEKTRVFV